jgi:RimJ/RimL family protein N-acetyltransferase
MIELKPFAEADFDILISWVDSAETLVQFAGLNFSFPLTYSQLSANLENKKIKAYKAIHLPTNRIVGYGEIYITDENEAILGKIIIGDSNDRGQGLGAQIVQQLLLIAFTQLKINKAQLYVFDWNIGAIKCYEKVGFLIEKGITKKRDVNGKTWIAIKMFINKNAWKPDLKVVHSKYRKH